MATRRPKRSEQQQDAKASVIYARQDPKARQTVVVHEDKPKDKEPVSCCVPLEKFVFQTILAFPDPNKPSAKGGTQYAEKQELRPLPPVLRFEDASSEEKQGVQVTINTAPKETPGWVNQDRGICHLLPDAGDGETRFFFGVFDGHGRKGHDASDVIASRLASHLVLSDSSLSNPSKALQEAFTKVDHDVYSALGPDVEYSGSTGCCVMVDWTSRQLHSAHIGDSRAILGRQLHSGSWEAIQLTADHKPDLPDEKERIEMHLGVVSPNLVAGIADGPPRVWDSPLLEKPGLACSRSIGDGAARLLGVVADAEVSSRKIEPEDKFIIVASDGLWDSMSNDEVVAMAKQYLCIPFVGVKALTEAVRRVEGGVLTDDTTMVFVVLQQ